MIYRDFEISRNTLSLITHNKFIAIHYGFDVDMDSDGTCTFSHPVIVQDTIAECKAEIDDWYAETGGEAWR